MRYLFSAFLLLTSSGALLSLLLAPRDQLGESFFRLFALLFGIFVWIGAGVAFQGSLPAGLWQPTLAGAAALALVHLWAVRSQSRIEAPTRALLILLGWVASFAMVSTWTEESAPIMQLVLGLSLGTTSLLLGTTLASMMCGHWYLIDRKLDFAILRGFVKALIAAVALKTVGFLGAFLLATGHHQDLAKACYTPGSFANILLALRFGLSCVFGGIFAYMIWDCVKRESNQSATGLLYVFLILVFFGEVLSLMFASVSGVLL